MSWKNSLLVMCKMFRLFVNTLTVGDKYSLLNMENFNAVNPDAFIQETKHFSEFCSAFLEFRLNFEHFETKDDPHSWCNSEITDCERRG